ncbi:sodium:alanine symporter family protein [Maricaulaceae bacterium EIL42A08]|nr:sodium:alanine symporter family protein [Maricaulaceae bacterium EIL42A08]MCP2680114.1 sodium:alanine symporter family protein [Maricaulaceae bacterium NA33B04]
MEAFYDLVDDVSGFIWGGPMIILLLGTGLYFMIGMRFRPIRRLFPAFGELWAGRKGGGEGDITPWQALSTALSGQVGTGNLAGVATAITLGGPGAVFWMWITAMIGMAAAYSESSLAVRYRETHKDGRVHGGPMYYIKNGLGKWWIWLAVIFAIGTLFSALVTGNMTQANSIAISVTSATGGLIPVWGAGLIIAGLAFIVIIGGIKSIGSVAGKVVPIMALAYILVAMITLIINVNSLPNAIMVIFQSAFTGHAAVGGFIGGAFIAATRYGVERGLFSNEAGQGSTAIAHAASQTDSPVRQGEIAMVGTFIDTMVICTMTALVILSVQGNFYHNPALTTLKICEAQGVEGVNRSLIGEMPRAMMASADDRAAARDATSERALAAISACEAAVADGSVTIDAELLADAREAAVVDVRAPVERAWMSDAEASAVTTAVYEESRIPLGGILIAGCLTLFAFTTILGWAYYAEQALTFLVGDWATMPFRIIWVGAVFLGSIQQVDFIWRLGGIANAAMAAPNLIAILLLSGVVFAYTKKADEEGQGSNPAMFDPDKK